MSTSNHSNLTFYKGLDPDSPFFDIVTKYVAKRGPEAQVSHVTDSTGGVIALCRDRAGNETLYASLPNSRSESLYGLVRDNDLSKAIRDRVQSVRFQSSFFVAPGEQNAASYCTILKDVDVVSRRLQELLVSLEEQDSENEAATDLSGSTMDGLCS